MQLHPLSPLRILQIVPAYYPAVRYGGPIKSVHGLSAALVRRGHSVHVYTSSMDGESNLAVPLNQEVLIDGVAVRYFPVAALRRLCWCPALATHLRDNIESFDVVHLQSVFLWPTWAGAQAARSAGIPYLMSPRGMLGREVIQRKNRWVKTAWINLVERKSIRHAQAIHVTAELERDELKSLHLPLPTISCIANGVDLPAKHAQLADGPYAALPKRYALFLSRINWKKGLDRLIKAWQQVPDLPLVIAGNDEDQYQKSMETLARSEGVADRVHFIGPVADIHKWALYENASVFVLPSYSENFGNVVAEAMAMACPVVVTPEVGLASFVREHRAGLVTEGDPQQLATAICKLVNSPERTEMGIRGRHAVERDLSWDAVAQQMESTYGAAIHRNAALRAQRGYRASIRAG